MGLATSGPGGFPPMATSLAYLTQEPDPQLPLLSDTVPSDPQTEVQKEVQANLQNEIDSVLRGVLNPACHELSATILREMLRFFDWLARIENNLQKLDTLLESLSLLEVLEFEARSLTDTSRRGPFQRRRDTSAFAMSWTAFPTELLTIYAGSLNASWSVASPSSRYRPSTVRSCTHMVY